MMDHLRMWQTPAEQCRGGGSEEHRPGRHAPALRRWTLGVALCLSGAALPAQDAPPSYPLRGPVGGVPLIGPTVGPMVGPVDEHAVPVLQGHGPLPSQIAALPGIGAHLDVIHHRSQLVVARSNIPRWAIADPSIIEVAQYSPNEIAVLGVGLGSTTLTLWFDGNPEPLVYLVTVVRDPSLDAQKRLDYGRLEEKLAYLFPNSKVYLIPLSHKIIVKGQAADAEEAARILQIVRDEVITQEGALINPAAAVVDPTDAAGPYGAYGPLSSYIVNMLEVPGEKQIMLHVRIAELNREQLRQMGIDLNVLINNGRHVLSTVNGGFPGAVTGIFENGEIGVLINWLASNGMVKFLSAPTLTVLSGHPASFLAGGEFAVPTIVGVDGVGAQQTTFRGFGTSLVVVPTVIDHDLVRMRIIPEFSEVNFNNAVGGIPGVDSRRVHTTVQLREGQTIALAGLYAQRTDTEITRIPWLSDIPFIGSRIFSAKRATQDQTELLVLVTPEIVRPMDAEDVPTLPGYNVTPPDHIQLFKAAMGEGPPDLDQYELAPLGHSEGVGRSIGPYQPRVPSVDPVTGPYPPMSGHGGYPGGYDHPPVVAPPVQRQPYRPPSQGYYPPAADPSQMRPRNQWPAAADPLPMPNGYGPTPVPPAEERAPSPQPQSYHYWPRPSTSSISAPAPTRWTQTLPPVNETVTPAGYNSDGTRDTERKMRIPLFDRFTRP